MRSYSPRHKNIQRQLRERSIIAERIKEAILREEDVTADVRALQRNVATNHRADPSEITCFRCDVAIDEDSEEFGVITVNAASMGPRVEPTRYKGEFMPVLPLCLACLGHFFDVATEQEV